MARTLHLQRNTRRVAAVLLALSNLCATSLAALDAAIDGEVMEFGLHLGAEDHEHHEGHRHGHAECQVIQSLAATTPASGQPSLAWDALPLVPDTQLARTQLTLAAPLSGSFGPRGPPTL